MVTRTLWLFTIATIASWVSAYATALAFFATSQIRALLFATTCTLLATAVQMAFGLIYGFMGRARRR